MAKITITNKDELETWLNTREHADCIAIATRAAQRCLPNLAPLLDAYEEYKYNVIILPLCRSIHASSVAHWARATSEAREAILSATRSSVSSSAAVQFSASANSIATAHSASASNTAAETAIYAAHAARSITHAVTSAKFADSVNSTALSIAWSIIGRDVNVLADGASATDLLEQPLWPTDPPDWAVENWQTLRTALLDAKGEDWGVWIDWYEARLAGTEKSPRNPALDEAILLIPDETWRAGAAVANAEIRRLINLHSRATLERLVSPEPVSNRGKIDSRANRTADIPDDIARIIALPDRLRDVIGTLLDMIAAKTNACIAVVPPLTRYDAHLAQFGPRPRLDSLNDLHQIVRDEYLGLYREKLFEQERGLRKAFLIFFKLHKEFRTAFAEDAIREQAIRTYRLESEKLDASSLTDTLDAIKTGVNDAYDAGAATAQFRDDATELADTMRHALETPNHAPPITEKTDDPLTDPIPQEKLWPVRALLKGGTYFSRAYRLVTDPVALAGSLAGIVGFLDSERGQKFKNALRKAMEAIFESDEQG